jgi:hypothetical protein
MMSPTFCQGSHCAASNIRLGGTPGFLAIRWSEEVAVVGWGKKGQLAQFGHFLAKIVTNKTLSFIDIKK